MSESVVVHINGQRFRYWTSVKLSQAVDKIAAVTLTAPFTPDQKEFRDAFRPFSYAPVEIYVGDALAFRGTALHVTPTLSPDSNRVTLSAYALPGVLNDCTPPPSAYPLEYDGLTLGAIARTIAKPFGLAVEIQGGTGSAFERAACAPGTKALSFLTDLAQQRGRLISSTAEGALLIHKAPSASAPVARLEAGQPPVSSIVAAFSPQEYYSQITGLEPVIIGLTGAQHTEKNPHLSGVLRPLTFTAPDSLEQDLAEATRAKIGRMVGNMAAYTVDVATWRDPAGAMWAPGSTLKLRAPRAMIYSEYDFILRSVDFSQSDNDELATLYLTLPGAFAGTIPERLPWDD